MNLATDLINQHKDMKESNEAEILSYGGVVKAKVANTVVPLDEARRRVVTESYGEITRRKTEDKNVVEILAGGQVIGTAVAVYKSKTQRTWTLTVGDVVLEKQHTISKGIRAIEAMPKEAKVVKVPKPRAKAKAKANG